MSTKNPLNPVPLGLKATPISTMVFKVHDLRRDVDCLKSTYNATADPNKTRIERVLTNMKRKLNKADQILQFGQSATEYSVTEDKTKVALMRVQKLKDLFKDLLKGQGNMSTPERRSLSQMLHQLLSMEDDLVHFTDPRNSGSGRCRSNGEPHWMPAKNCKVQAVLLTDLCPDGMGRCEATKVSSGKEQRTVCCAYPQIEESSDGGEDETRTTVFSIVNRRERLQETECTVPGMFP